MKHITSLKNSGDKKGPERHKKEILKQRNKILKIADYIIPGHGKMFKVKRG